MKTTTALLIAALLLSVSARADEVQNTDKWKLPQWISPEVTNEVYEFYKSVGRGRPWEFWWRMIKKYRR